MSKVTTGATRSLDGFIADAHHGVEYLFKWYGEGDVDVPVPTGDPNLTVTGRPPRRTR
jgi:hypothetical protein